MIEYFSSDVTNYLIVNPNQIYNINFQTELLIILFYNCYGLIEIMK